MASLRRALLLSVVLAGSGCKNNTIELDFEDTEDPAGSSTTANADDGVDDDGGSTGRMTTTMPGTVTTPTTMTTSSDDDTGSAPAPGLWLMAVSTPLDPSLPFQFLVDATEPEPGLWTLSLQPLSLDIGSTTTPRQPAGSPFVYSGVTIGGDLPFMLYTGPITIPGAANPISGTDVTIDAGFNGAALGDPYCGMVGGSVTAPVASDLAGSTFATTVVPDAATLPETFPVACP